MSRDEVLAGVETGILAQQLHALAAAEPRRPGHVRDLVGKEPGTGPEVQTRGLQWISIAAAGFGGRPQDRPSQTDQRPPAYL